MGMRDLDIDLLRGFVAVVEGGGFTSAAALLGRTQSAVSMQVRRLEDICGHRLIDREHKPVRPTPAGDRLLAHARRMLALNRAALDGLAGPPAPVTVRLGLPDDYAARFLSGVLGYFARETPGADVVIECDVSGRVLARLADGGLDLALAARIEGDGGPGRVLRREPVVWALPRFAPPPLPADDGVGGGEGAAVPLALMPEGCPFRRMATDALAAAGRPWRPAFASNALGGIAASVAAGLTVSVLAAGNLGEDLRAAAPGDGLPALPTVEIVLVGPGPQAPRAAHRLGDLLAERLAGAGAAGAFGTAA